MAIRELLERDPYRQITSVVRVTDHKSDLVWPEMDEYVPTDGVKMHFRDILDALLETRQGPTERACVWVSGFFGSGKSHLLKVLGYLLENRELQDPDGHTHSSTELLCSKLGLETFVPILTRELQTRVVFINLLDHDPQAPNRRTISRLVYRSLLEEGGYSTDFWVAEWERELQTLGKWESFLSWVRDFHGRDWSAERRLNAQAVLRRALVKFLPTRHANEEMALDHIRDSKVRFGAIRPSYVIGALRQQAEMLDPRRGRMVVLLDEVGLYIGDDKNCLTNLNELAEQVKEKGNGKVVLVATAQEALPELVPRLTADRQILDWLLDRFRLRLGLKPTEVRAVVAKRLLAKTPGAVGQLRDLYQAQQGALHASLSLDRSWREKDFVSFYPFPPYVVQEMQDIMSAMRGSLDEARRLSGGERSMLKLAHAILSGEGEVCRGAEQPVGWLVGLDNFYDALRPDLSVIRSEQVRVIDQFQELGDVDGLPVARVAKVLLLLQQVNKHYPTTLENLASCLVDRVDQDILSLREAASECLGRLKGAGWVVEEGGQYRLLTAGEHELESDINRNLPGPAELSQGGLDLLREILNRFRYEHGHIRRPLDVALKVDGHHVTQTGQLTIELLTPFAGETHDKVLRRSIAESQTLFWMAAGSPELRSALERAKAVENTLAQWKTKSLTPLQQEHRSRVERELQIDSQTRLPQLMTSAFMRGSLYLAGQELQPAGNDVPSVLRSHLQSIATQAYIEFVDDRPDRDHDCAAILAWQPGTVLPQVYNRLGLLTVNNTINQDAGLLAIVRAEVKRREQIGLPRTGKDFTDHYATTPYGWDPRLVRLVLATLFKAGIVGVRYQHRDILDPTNPQARQLFEGQREFRHVTLSLVPEVDWRAASELCSELFITQGGDTYERTAAVVRGEASRWTQRARNLATRCADNGLPQAYATACREAGERLDDVAQQRDPNACLRLFLAQADSLKVQTPVLRQLQEFPFQEFGRAGKFANAVTDWSMELDGDAAERWARLKNALQAADLLDRWNQAKEGYALLLSRYREDYGSRHEHSQEVIQALAHRLRQHEAFRQEQEAAEEAMQPLTSLRCDADRFPVESGALRCSKCHRSFAALSPAAAEYTATVVERKLDSLVKPSQIKEERLSILSFQGTVASAEQIDSLTMKLRNYWLRAGHPLRVRLEARIAEEEG